MNTYTFTLMRSIQRRRFEPLATVSYQADTQAQAMAQFGQDFLDHKLGVRIEELSAEDERLMAEMQQAGD